MPDKFEIVISFDTTCSMYEYLEEVRRRLDGIVRRLKREIPGIKIAIFAHGDYCSADIYVTKHIDFTDDVDKLCRFVQGVEKTYGDDFPECYELVLKEVQEKLSWSRDSNKVLVMVGDAPPHEPDYKHNRRRIDWRIETKNLRDMHVKIYAVDCYGKYQEFYQHIASQSFGYYWPLSNINEVGDLILKVCFREAGLENYGSFTEAVPSYRAKQDVKTGENCVSSELDRLMEEESSDEEDSQGMRCDICRVTKLPTEFPAETFSEECDHCTGVCMRCVVEFVYINKKCPQPGCSVVVDPECQLMRVIEATLETMFLDYAKVLAENRKLAVGASGDVITVSTINGDTAWIPYRGNMTITELKKAVEKRLSLPESSQKILFKNQVLKGSRRLVDFNINKNDELNVIVPLYCVPEHLDHVVFDLSWEFPKVNPDFLDASCLAFNKTEFVQVIDWNHSSNRYYLKDAVKHSTKNEIRGGGKFGHQTIHVSLKRLPWNISHLYFTLSSWRSPDLSAFSNPSLQFYEASAPDVDLCSTTFGHALSHPAVIICSLVRDRLGWSIYDSYFGADACINGNAKKYNPIRERIVELIKNE